MKDIYTTADLNAMLAEADAQQKRARRPMSNAMLGGIVPQVSAQDAAINRPDPVERASLFPLATYPDGSTRLALPGMIAEDIPRAFTAPARAYRGEIADEDMISEGLNFAGNMAMTGGIAPKPSNAAGMFGGRLAKTADHTKLATAEKMAAEGAPREAIWRDTGWFQGVDGKWRFEIDDSGAAMKYPSGDVAGSVAKTMGVEGKMGDIFHHPKTYFAYPDVAAIDGDIGMLRNGTYYSAPGPGGEKISVNAHHGERVPYTLHEIQHSLQEREGFAKGGSIAGLRESLQGKVPDEWLTDRNLKESYRRMAGEVEARAVERRSSLTPLQRQDRAPWLDYDVPESQQIVRFNANSSEAAAPGVLASEAARQPQTFKGYSGMGNVPDKFTRGPWASDSPSTANSYTTDGPASYLAKQPVIKDYSAVMPLEFKFDNPMIVDAKGSRYNGIELPGQELSNSNRLYYQAEDLGHDGLVIKNVRDDVDGTGQPATTIAAIKPGTTYSGITGDLLFENGKNAVAPGVVMAEAARQPRPVQLEVPFYRGSANGQTAVDYNQPYWGTTDKSLASDYAKSRSEMYFRDGTTPNVTPAVGRFRNPLYIDAQNAGWSDIPFEGQKWNSDKLADLAKERGHDGLVIDRLYDEGRFDEAMGLPATVAALRPGTVSSAFDPNNILYANSKSSGVPGAMIAEAADQPRGIRAYHGSQHDFDRFDMSKIGTGEGAQAYGHGLYFAENEGVAKSYRDRLSGNHVVSGGKIIPRAGTDKYGNLSWHSQRANLSIAEDMLADHNGNYDRSIRDLKALKAAKTKRPDDKFITETIDDLDVAIRQLEELRAKEGSEAKSPSGKMYEVNINAHPDDFIDWDKPLSQQSEKAQAAVRKYMNLADGSRMADLGWKNISTRPINDAIGDVLRSDTAGLREAGIPGIKYLDQGSRTAGEGSRNYVVFDDALIEIIRKYMNPQTAIAPGALMVEGSKDGRQ